MTPGALRVNAVVDRGDGFVLDVDFTIGADTTVALLGPSGAGKTTVLEAIAGLLPLDAGRISLGDVVLDDPSAGVYVPPEQRRLGVVFQDYLLFPHLDVLSNINFGLARRGVERKARGDTAREWLDRLGLSALAHRLPADLSGGQAQRVALARALAVEPRALLLDEPLSALDVSTRSRLRAVLGDHLGDFRGPRLLITHDPTEAFLLADEINIIESGAITQSGSPDEIRLRPKTRYAADLAGSNLLAGTASDGVLTTGDATLRIPDHRVAGPVLATISPRAISVHRSRPEGSPRNSWVTTVRRMEVLGETARLQTGDPLRVTVEITRDSVDALGLAEGDRIWVSIKATEIAVRAEEPVRDPVS